MNVGVMGQCLPPGVQDADEAKLAAQTMTRIGSDGLERRGDDVEQDTIEQPLVLVGDRRDLAGHGKYDMEIGYRQKVGFAIGKPLVAGGTLALGTMPVAAGVIGDTRVCAVIAGLDMPTKRRRPAQLDRGQDTAFHPAEMAVVSVGIDMAMAAENIRHLQLGTHGDLRRAEPPQGSNDPADSAPQRSWSWLPACSAPSSTGCYAPAEPG